MTLRRFMWIFVAIAVGAFALALLGRFVLAWPDNMVGMWAGIGAGYLLGALLFLLTPRWWRQHCDDMYAQPAGRRYLRVLWPALVAYSLALFASIWLIKQGIASVPLRAVVAVLPVLPIALMMGAGLRYLRPRRSASPACWWRCCISPAACCRRRRWSTWMPRWR